MSSHLKMATDVRQKSSEQANATGQLLKQEFDRLGKCVSEALSLSGQKISDDIAARNQELSDALRHHSNGMTEAMQSHRERRDAPGNAPVAVSAHDLAAAGGGVRGRAVAPELENSGEPGRNRGAERHAGEAEREDVGRDVSGGQQRTFSGAAEGYESRSGLDGGEREAERGEAGEGVRADDRAGNAVAERIRAATAGLLAKAGRVGERLRGIADDVWSYARGQRAAERAGHALKSAGGALERATESFEPVVQRHKYEVAAARAQVVHEQRQKEPVKEREYPGPSLEL
ncbi:hypothetical protein GTR92_001434 [Salmonella enterica]|nr:hypothetical protein [Salmonella enterica]